MPLGGTLSLASGRPSIPLRVWKLFDTPPTAAFRAGVLYVLVTRSPSIPLGAKGSGAISDTASFVARNNSANFRQSSSSRRTSDRH